MDTDKKMDEQRETLMDNILTMAGAALLMYPVIKQATKSLSPELDNFIGENKTPLLEVKQEKHDDSDREEERKKHEDERKTKDDEIAELKRKLAEFESKSAEHKDDD